MLTFEKIKDVNERIKKIDVKGKNYAVVASRVQAFRELCPNGSIATEIVDMKDGVVTMRTTVRDEDGHILGTGFAQEKESSSYINKTSYIENCETSAVGRALGMLGIGSDEQMASAEEVANAINNQGKAPKKGKAPDEADLSSITIDEEKVKKLRSICGAHIMPEGVLAGKYMKNSIEELTLADWVDFSKTGKDFLEVWDLEHEGPTA